MYIALNGITFKNYKKMGDFPEICKLSNLTRGKRKKMELTKHELNCNYTFKKSPCPRVLHMKF